MDEQRRLIFLHGLEGSSQGVKASLLRGLFPSILTPDFRGSLDERMHVLRSILKDEPGWTIIGSSFGGLMAALFAIENPGQVEKSILLAPALIWPSFASADHKPVAVPTIIYHGNQDQVISLERSRRIAESIFQNLTFYEVDDDHGLYKTVHAIDWRQLI